MRIVESKELFANSISTSPFQKNLTPTLTTSIQNFMTQILTLTV